ncbi:MAG: hypothetical protein US79_C0008G0021 [Parcubacteria group bacterium GW2011_GWC1_38_17]|nr:MAG: hypothetical protein US06_C0004G0020 [Parcubacteria group bacterium GW2011_GWC2_36_17]KKQ58398.1 MAG: hypothetical protein US79_C0008G0021 [Parcubacteria group bacterium GW2011_GWC1_38_17]
MFKNWGLSIWKSFVNCRIGNWKLESQQGHTIAELMVVVTIIIVLSGISLYNYQIRKKSDILILETQKVAQAIRRAQNLALSPQVGGSNVNGFGVYIITTVAGGKITIFKDLNADYKYSSGESGESIEESIEVEELILNSQVKISKLESLSETWISDDTLNLLYIPPDPSVTIYNSSASTSASTAVISISLIDDSQTKKIKVNLTGLVEVQ